MNIVLWVVQGLLALSCVFSSLSKAFRPLATVKQQFPWADHVPASQVRFIGASELAGGIGLILPALTGIFPWLTVAAAVGLVLLMLCAAIFHVRHREFPSIGGNAVLLGLSMFPRIAQRVRLCVIVSSGRVGSSKPLRFNGEKS